MSKTIKQVLSFVAITAVIAVAAVGFTATEAEADPPDSPTLCVLTLDCGGFCGTEQAVNAFLNRCAAQNQDNGPCLSDCWNACLHAASNSQSPNLRACTLECSTNARCQAGK